MAVSNPGWEKWLERLYNLRRDKSGSHVGYFNSRLA
jgi:hypothetical protein